MGGISLSRLLTWTTSWDTVPAVISVSQAMISYLVKNPSGPSLSMSSLSCKRLSARRASTKATGRGWRGSGRSRGDVRTTGLEVHLNWISHKLAVSGERSLKNFQTRFLRKRIVSAAIAKFRLCLSPRGERRSAEHHRTPNSIINFLSNSTYTAVYS